MNLLFYLIFRMPWFGYIALGAGVIALAHLTEDATNERIADIEAAIASGPPRTVMLDDYNRPNQRFAEATLRVQIAMDETVRLVDRTNGVKTGEDYMFVLTDPAQTAGVTGVNALMILDKSEFGKFEDWLVDNMVGVGALGPIVEINGSVSKGDGEASHAKDALQERNRTASRDMIYVTPFFDGRDATLARQLETSSETIGLMNGIGAFIALFGIAKLLIVKRYQALRKQRATEAALAPQT